MSLYLFDTGHRSPVHPGRQVQLKKLTRSLQVAWFSHRLLAHSLMSEFFLN